MVLQRQTDLLCTLYIEDVPSRIKSILSSVLIYIFTILRTFKLYVSSCKWSNRGAEVAIVV